LREVQHRYVALDGIKVVLLPILGVVLVTGIAP
jgi:hypothetical protein